MSSTQHRCVFVGNIPYDATEDELIRICEEVGPVVNFRLVVDRETGKPKGYGFCEYRDEETALSARRNLQGYEINGRQLRVDFAENEKGSGDRSREQGRGGPGLVDMSKQLLGPKVARDLSLHQAIGIHAAASAAGLMANLLGAPQIPAGSNVLSGTARAPTIDPLSVHLAGMSKYQLYEIIQLMKNFIQQNQQQARQVLMANPQLAKALFQAQIMLGFVPQMIPLSQSAPTPMISAQGQVQISAGVQQSQPQRALNIPFHLSHPSQQQATSRPAGMLPPQSIQVPPPLSTVGPQQWTQPQLSVQPPLPQQARPPSPSRAPQTLGFQHSQSQQLPQQPGGMPPSLASLPYQGMPPPLPTKPLPQHLQGGLKVSTSSSAGGVTQLMKGPGTDMPMSSVPFASWSQVSTSMVSAVTGAGQQGTVRVTPNDGTGVTYSQEYNPPSTQTPTQQQTQVSLEPEQQKALLQQVMNLTPEQINSLPPEQRQQVLDLQQAFRNQII